MTDRSFRTALALLLVSLPFPLACGGTDSGGSDDEVSPTTPEEPSGAAGAAGASGTGGNPEEVCVPADGPDLPDDDFEDSNCDGIDGEIESSIFVDAAAAAGGDGSPEAPFATIGEALVQLNSARLAGEMDQRILLCEGVYDESVSLDLDGTHLHGGYACTDGWKRTGGAVEVRSAELPLFIEGASDITLDHLSFIHEGGHFTSVAAHLKDAGSVVFNSVLLQAADGQKGADGEPAQGHRIEASAGDPGTIGDSSPAMYGIGGMGGSQYVCPGTGRLQYSGGEGGHGGLGVVGSTTVAEDGWDGGPNTPGGIATRPGFGSLDGFDGSLGKIGERGQASTLPLGSFVDGVYVAGNSGGDGEFGERGTAGGGGAGAEANFSVSPYRGGAGGGAGGTGGCGGYPGKGGQGGGGSFALVLEGSSSVTITGSTLRTGAGGQGGEPSAGGTGQKGGLGGRGGNYDGASAGVHPGGDGGDGGRGGSGGYGAAGGGGPSVGIARLARAAVIVSDTTFELGGGGSVGEVGLAQGALEGLAANGYDFDAREGLTFD